MLWNDGNVTIDNVIHVERFPKVTSIRQHGTPLVRNMVVRSGALAVRPGGRAESKDRHSEVRKAVHIDDTKPEDCKAGLPLESGVY